MACVTFPYRFLLVGLLFGASVVELTGCASPAAPKPPSLHLPAAPKDLAALRQGREVEVSFTVPSRTTDGLLLSGPVIHAQVCLRPTIAAACTAVPLDPVQRDIPLARNKSKDAHITWHLLLPAPLCEGPVAAAAIEVEFLNGSGKGAGWSAPAWFAAGATPQPVTALQATGTRQGTLLRWQAVAGASEVLLVRTQLAAGTDGRPQGKLGEEVTLQADPGSTASHETLDPSMQAGVPMRYLAYRRTTTQVGGHTLVSQSAMSAPLSFTWRDIYPPPAPTLLKAVGFQERSGTDATSSRFSVDLIWEPVDDARVTGYLVTRSPASRPGEAVTLTQNAVTTPAFHDTTASPGTAYRYDVVAVDAAGNRSAAVATIFSGQ